MRLDAHQHFWEIARGDYGWLNPGLGLLYRDYAPADLEQLIAGCGIDGTILVQAAPTVAETHYLLRLAAENEFIRGVVGWIDFEAATAASQIDQLAESRLLVGLRPMIQDIEDLNWMLKPELNPAFEALIAADLTFDALVFPKHLPKLLELLQRYSSMRVVIDHGAKPQIAAGAFQEWATLMQRLADESNAYCKLSGLVTEATQNWSPDDLRPYIEHLIDTFGAERLIWGSDWPVVKLAADYRQWYELARSYFPIPEDERRVFGQNAMLAYRL